MTYKIITIASHALRYTIGSCKSPTNFMYSKPAINIANLRLDFATSKSHLWLLQ